MALTLRLTLAVSALSPRRTSFAHSRLETTTACEDTTSSVTMAPSKKKSARRGVPVLRALRVARTGVGGLPVGLVAEGLTLTLF